MVFTFPWDAKFSQRELRSKLVPVWVDLPRVHPLLEAYGSHMLATIGKVLYKTCEMGRDSHMHIRGCVLTDISRVLDAADKVTDPNDGFEKVQSKRQKGNHAGSSPKTGQPTVHPLQEEESGDEDEEIGEDDLSDTLSEPDSTDATLGGVQLGQPGQNMSTEVNNAQGEEDRTGGAESFPIEALLKPVNPKKSAKLGAKGGKVGENLTGDEVIGRGEQIAESKKGTSELKALENILQFNLGRIWENGRVVVDYSQSDRGGAVLIVHPSLQILNTGVRGDGTCAWAEVSTVLGPIYFMSIYAPNESPDRKRLWTWLNFKVEEGRWAIVGDMNSVELPDDTDGPTALLNGGELRLWKTMTADHELIDAYLCASFTVGPRFTRHVFSGTRLDQARLDRCYLSGGGGWLNHVHQVKHDASQTLSDHWPVIVDLKLIEKETEEIRRSSYYKMRTEDLKCSSTRANVKKAWESHPENIRDPRARWHLGWQRVKAVLRAQSLRKAWDDEPIRQQKQLQELLAIRMR
ncbi:hypothetical protein R1sor_026866 [Riccia sorocarpa]|uniref:DUF4283 domain-containing protein n=1 Tax=Riccia sorocarpa TaxID=122646 RepID=A0ABD3GCK1_9MARC